MLQDQSKNQEKLREKSSIKFQSLCNINTRINIICIDPSVTEK